MSEQNRRLRAAGIAALAWAGLAAVWCVLVPGGAAELPQGVPGTLRSLLVLPLAEELVFRGALLRLLRQAAETTGLIILTDSDGAGFLIRNTLKSALPAEGVLHAYIPDIPGKERRKRAPGKEGKLGVEGMKPEVILEALRRAGATFLDETAEPAAEKTPLPKAELMEWGLAGGADSARRRQALLRRLDLPEHLPANGMLEALNLLTDREELAELLQDQ